MFERIAEKFQTVRRFIRNIWIFRNTLATHRWYDYAGLLQAMYDSIADMEKRQRISDSLVNTEKNCDKMRIILHLIQRIQDDTYTTRKAGFEMVSGEPLPNGLIPCTIEMHPKHDFPKEAHIHKYSRKQGDADLEYLTKLLNKHLRSFWD